MIINDSRKLESLNFEGEGYNLNVLSSEGFLVDSTYKYWWDLHQLTRDKIIHHVAINLISREGPSRFY